MWNMEPIAVPPEAEATRPEMRKISVGPPPGVSDADCGTVEALVSKEPGRVLFADYWRPTLTQMAALAKGGFIELIQYTPQMVMHSMTVWPVVGETNVPTEHTNRLIALNRVVELRDQLVLAADGVAATPQQLGSIYALQYVVEQLNAIVGAPEIPVPDDEADEQPVTSDGDPEGSE